MITGSGPSYWLAGSASDVKPLLRLSGLCGVASARVLSPWEAEPIREQLFGGTCVCTSIVLGTTDVCRSPSARSGGLVRTVVGVGSELGTLELWEGQGLGVRWSLLFDWSSCGCSPGGVVSLSSKVGLAGSGAGSCCMLLCLEAPEPGISQLSVRRREPSCIRLVATTAFIAACKTHTHTGGAVLFYWQKNWTQMFISICDPVMDWTSMVNTHWSQMVRSAVRRGKRWCCFGNLF